MITIVYLYELRGYYREEECYKYTFPTFEKAVNTACRRYKFDFDGNGALKNEEFEKVIRDRKWYDEDGYSWDIVRVKQEVDIPKVNIPTTVGDIVCGGFDAALEYVVYHGVHEDGDILWSTSANSRLTEDDTISSYVVSYLTIDKETGRLIIETL